MEHELEALSTQLGRARPGVSRLRSGRRPLLADRLTLPCPRRLCAGCAGGRRAGRARFQQDRLATADGGVFRRLADAHRAGEAAAAKPSLLLLDEPTNHLDLETRNWLEDYLRTYPNGYILISHDRYFLDVTVNKIVEIWNKALHVYHGNYEKYLSRSRSAARSSKPPTATSASRSSISRPSSTASAIRPRRRSRCRAASRNWRRSSASRFPQEEPVIHFTFPQPPASGRTVVEVRDLAKSYGAKQVLEGCQLHHRPRRPHRAGRRERRG